MYVFNGFVYGENPQESIKVETVKPLNDMTMLVGFSNGEIRLFDASILNGPVFQSLRDQEIFNNPKIDHGVVTWKDGELDCAPEYMYKNSYKYHVENLA